MFSSWSAVSRRELVSMPRIHCIEIKDLSRRYRNRTEGVRAGLEEQIHNNFQVTHQTLQLTVAREKNIHATDRLNKTNFG